MGTVSNNAPNDQQESWSTLCSNIYSHNEDGIQLVLNEGAKRVALLGRSLVRYVVNIGVIACEGSEVGVLLDKSNDDKEYRIKNNKSVFVLKPMQSKNMATPIFTNNNYIFLESNKGTLSKFELHKNHTVGIYKYLSHFCKYLNIHKHLISRVRFNIPICIADKLYNMLYAENKEAKSKLATLQKHMNNIVDFYINIQEASSLDHYRETQWDVLGNDFKEINKLISSFSYEEKLISALLVECLLCSNKFLFAPVDNQIALLSFLLKTNNSFWSCCSVFNTSQRLLSLLVQQDIGDFVDKENVVPLTSNDENANFKEQLILIKEKFQFDKANEISLHIAPTYSLGTNKGIITKVINRHSNIKRISSIDEDYGNKDSWIFSVTPKS